MPLCRARMATAANICVAKGEETVSVGALDVDCVHVPASS